MRLIDHIITSGCGIGGFADKIGVSHETVRRYCNGSRVPAQDAMRAIFIATSGAVSPNDFFDLPAPPNDDSDRDEAA